jgi:CHAT domain-containing protein
LTSPICPRRGISVASALLAAGAACVIASLWPVRDDTTALLITRLYEEMIGSGYRPPEALRRAQLWPRELTDPELDAFLEDHASLAAEFTRRAAAGDGAGRRAVDYWAPFIAIGA